MNKMTDKAAAEAKKVTRKAGAALESGKAKADEALTKLMAHVPTRGGGGAPTDTSVD